MRSERVPVWVVENRGSPEKPGYKSVRSLRTSEYYGMVLIQPHPKGYEIIMGCTSLHPLQKLYHAAAVLPAYDRALDLAQHLQSQLEKTILTQSIPAPRELLGDE